MSDRESARATLVEAIELVLDETNGDAAAALAVIESARPPCKTCGGDGYEYGTEDPEIGEVRIPCPDCRDHPGFGPLPYIDIMRGGLLDNPSMTHIYVRFPRATGEAT